jgi:hypothetical protein
MREICRSSCLSISQTFRIGSVDGAEPLYARWRAEAHRRIPTAGELNIYDSAFAQRMTEVFEADLKASTSYDFARWKNRPLSEKIAEVVLIPIKSQL